MTFERAGVERFGLGPTPVRQARISRGEPITQDRLAQASNPLVG
jgi:hypothetical protein